MKGEGVRKEGCLWKRMEMKEKWDETEEGGVEAEEKEIARIAIECTWM